VYKTGPKPVFSGGIAVQRINNLPLKPLAAGKNRASVGVKSQSKDESGTVITPEISGLTNWVNDEFYFRCLPCFVHFKDVNLWQSPMQCLNSFQAALNGQPTDNRTFTGTGEYKLSIHRL